MKCVQMYKYVFFSIQLYACIISKYFTWTRATMRERATNIHRCIESAKNIFFAGCIVEQIQVDLSCSEDEQWMMF